MDKIEELRAFIMRVRAMMLDHHLHHEAGGSDPVDLSGYVAKTLFNANTILKADTNNTPIALTVAASRILGRKAAGGIVAMSGAELMALLSGKAGADFSMNTHKITGVVDPIADQHAATKKYVDTEVLTRSLFVWNDGYDNVLDIDDDDPAIGWTTIDINAIVGNNAKMVILQFRFLSNVCGTAGTSHIAIRKENLANSQYIAVIWHNNPDPTEKRGIGICELSDTQTFDYTIGEATAAAGFAIDLNVMAWIE